MPLNTQTFNQVITSLVNAIAANTPKATNFTPGSLVYAITQAMGGNTMMLQYLVSYVYNVTRLTSSTGADVDSFLADFGLARLGSTPATVQESITRNSTSGTLNIAPGGVIQTLSNTQFTCVADTSNPYWNAGAGVYTFPSTVATIQVTMSANVPGTAGNVQVGTLTQIVSGFSGVSSVTNAAAASGGTDQETDSAAKARFLLYIASLGKGSLGAIEYAVSSVQTGLTYQILDRENPDFSSAPASFSAIVDDGSGAISSGLLNEISTAVNLYRAAGIQYQVVAPTNVPIAVVTTVVPSSGYSHATVAASVTANLTAYINGLGTGVSVNYADLENVIQKTTGVYSYSGTTLNGSAASVTIALNQLPRTGTITVN